jgi:hypothetical protein
MKIFVHPNPLVITVVKLEGVLKINPSHILCTLQRPPAFKESIELLVPDAFRFLKSCIHCIRVHAKGNHHMAT